MAQGFLGLNIALSGLFANQRQLGIVSHNVANAHTEGYSRQMMQTKAYSPEHLAGGLGSIGTGVDVNAVKQVRDAYLDYKMRYETSIREEWTARSKTLKEIEGIFNEPSEAGLSKLVDSFYASIRSLQENPENLTARALVRQNIIAVSEGVGRVSNMLKNIQKDLNFEFKTCVTDVNGIAEKIEMMNKAIHKAELEGGYANDLRDKRNLLVDQLSEYVKVDYYEDKLRRFHVLVGGQQLVAHYRSDRFEMIPRENDLNDDDSHGIYDIQWNNSNPIRLESGKLKGLQDIRDNIEGDLKGIPYYIDKLNEFVTTMVQDFNEIHSGGFGLDGSTGSDMFTIKNYSTAEFKDYILKRSLNGKEPIEVTESILQGVDAVQPEQKRAKINENIENVLQNNPEYKRKTVFKQDGKYYIIDKIKASELSQARDLEDLNKIAAASAKEDLPGDRKNMLKLLQTRHQQDMYDWGSPEDFLKSLVSNLGVDAQDAYRVRDNQGMLVKEYTKSRDSVMGVSLDEEVANMMKFQKAYAANARMANVFDEMLELIVNRLGLVGR